MPFSGNPPLQSITNRDQISLSNLKGIKTEQNRYPAERKKYSSNYAKGNTPNAGAIKVSGWNPIVEDILGKKQSN